jgi:hypothetical protein
MAGCGELTARYICEKDGLIKPMKKVFIALLALALLLAACGARERDFNQFYSGESAGVSYLVVFNNQSGEMHKVTDRKVIGVFFDLLDTTAFIMQKDQSPRSNFMYWVDIYENNEPAIRLTFTDETARVKGIYFFLDRRVKNELDKLYAAGERIEPSSQPGS